MSTYFVPYSNDIPVAIEIKGHRMLVLVSDSEEINEKLDSIGASEVRKIDVDEVLEDEAAIFCDLALSVGGSVVVAEPGQDIDSMIKNLEDELPWIH